MADELPLSMIEEIIEDGQSIVLDGLDRLMSLRLIFESEGSIHCKHELIRQGVYARMGRVKRVAFHKRVAEALAGSTVEKDLSHIALHFHKAQVRDQAFAFASAAASRAEETGAYHEAIRFLQVARGNTKNRTNSIHLLAREANLHYREAEFDHALPLIAMAEQGFRELGDVQSAITWGVRHLHATSEAGRSGCVDSAGRLDRILEECEVNGFWERYVEGIECRLRILERENRVEELRATLSKLRQIPQKIDLRVRCLAASVQALGMIFGDGCGALDAAALALPVIGRSSVTKISRTRCFTG